MKHTYNIAGMTCNGCVTSVTEKLSSLDGIENVDIVLATGEVAITMNKHLDLNTIKSVLSDKYTISEIGSHASDIAIASQEEKSKLQQLKPLLLIFLYLFTATFLIHFRDWNMAEAMLDFMGLFYIVFSFFKLLDLKGFPESFRMYDPLAKVIPVYAWVYPFVEVALGIMFLMRFQVQFALIATIVILGITTFGVTKTLLDKKSIRCACLGTALKLPMTEATFIENAIMLVMAVTLLTQQFI